MPGKMRWTYALACVLLPVLWGLLMVRVTRSAERFIARRRSARGEDNREAFASSPEYHI